MTRTAELEFWFDFSCPYAYLASTQLERIVETSGVALRLQPMLLGGVFAARGVAQNLAGSLSAAKAAHNAADLRRFSALLGVPLNMPSGHPLRTVSALRALLCVGESLPLVLRFFKAYWVDGVPLDQPEGVRTVLEGAGLDSSAILERSETQAIKDELRRRTDEAIARGVFGAPTFFVNNALYFGQDRIPEVLEVLGCRPEEIVPLSPDEAPGLMIDFYFDFASPFSAIAASRVETLFPGRVRWRPVHLPGLLKRVNGSVELPAMSDAKLRFRQQDRLRQARRTGVSVGAREVDPLLSVLALRLAAVLDPDQDQKARTLIAAVFWAYWQQDLDVSDPEALVRLCGTVGLDGRELLLRAASEVGHRRWLDSQKSAVDVGVFGLPTLVLTFPGREPALFFGNDRMDLALHAARDPAKLA